jgi:hypothetical protein
VRQRNRAIPFPKELVASSDRWGEILLLLTTQSGEREIMKIMRLFILAFVAALLPACSSNHFGPFAVPSGYVYHTEIYKAPPGPELVLIEDEEEGQMEPLSFWAQPEETENADPVYVADDVMNEIMAVDQEHHTNVENVPYDSPVSLYVE